MHLPVIDFTPFKLLTLKFNILGIVRSRSAPGASPSEPQIYFILFVLNLNNTTECLIGNYSIKFKGKHQKITKLYISLSNLLGEMLPKDISRSPSFRPLTFKR